MSPTFESKHHEALAQFAANYFYVGRIRLKNAILLWKNGIDPAAQNHMIFELIVGYTNYALYEFALLLYDAKENLLKIDTTYKYADGSAISKVIEFRRHVLAHRGANWGSTGSKAVIDAVSENPLPILSDAISAAKEFLLELKKRDIKIYELAGAPPIPTMRLPQLKELLAVMPKSGMWVTVHNADEVESFFQRYE